MMAHIAGAVAMVVFVAAAKFGEAKVPVRKVIFVSGIPVEVKFCGLNTKGVGISSRVPLVKVL